MLKKVAYRANGSEVSGSTHISRARTYNCASPQGAGIVFNLSNILIIVEFRRHINARPARAGQCKSSRERNRTTTKRCE